MAWETFPYLYTSPCIHSWIFKTLRVIIFWVRVTLKKLNVICIQIHSIILSVKCHGLRNFPHSYTSPRRPFVNFWHPISYFFWVRVTHKMLNVNCMKIHSIILSVTCHDLRNFPPLIHIPSKHLWIFDTLQVFFFIVRVTHKMLNVNCMKIHSIILSVTCHSLRNFLPVTHIPLYPLMNFWNPMWWSGVIHGWGG